MARLSLLVLLVLLGCSAPAPSPRGAATEPPAPAEPTSAPAPSADATSAPSPSASKPSGETVCGTGLAAPGPRADALRAQARAVGLVYPDAFAGVAETVHLTGRLPSCYATKRDAGAAGWTPGRPVWEALPGGAIGGDRFGNREGLLPEPQPGGYREADLDYDGGRRGAHRLVFAERTRGRWDLWVTTDHYRSFTPVEAP